MQKRIFAVFFACSLLLIGCFGAAFAGIEHADSGDAFRSKVLDSKGIVLVDFWASWCGPCMRQGEILERLAAQQPELRIVKVSTESQDTPAAMYRIQSIPTLMIFKDGKPIDRWSGVTEIPVINGRVEHAKKIKIPE
ncbi:MAG: thioredoxin domain-containing protein [bacterium]|nr:thioredoxin domain-containing protein [bacterium]